MHDRQDEHVSNSLSLTGRECALDCSSKAWLVRCRILGDSFSGRSLHRVSLDGRGTRVVSREPKQAFPDSLGILSPDVLESRPHLTDLVGCGNPGRVHDASLKQPESCLPLPHELSVTNREAPLQHNWKPIANTLRTSTADILSTVREVTGIHPPRSRYTKTRRAAAGEMYRTETVNRRSPPASTQTPKRSPPPPPLQDRETPDSSRRPKFLALEPLQPVVSPAVPGREFQLIRSDPTRREWHLS